MWNILEAWRQNDKLSYLIAIENNQNQDEKVQELKKWEDQIWAILKKNVNIFSLALINDEDKQNQSLQKITAELNNNIEWCFHRFSNVININFIKAWRSSIPKTTEV